MYLRKSIVTLGVLCFIGNVYAQEVIRISKSEVLSRVKLGNTTLKMSDQDVLSAEGDYRQTNATYLPSIAASYTGLLTTNPLMAFGSKLNQARLTQNDFDPALLNNPSETKNFATKLAIEQPLINMDGFYQRKAAKSTLAAAQLKAIRTRDYIALIVEKAYMELQLAYTTVEVLNKVKTTALENRRVVENNFKQGYAQRADVLAVEIRLTEIENQLQYALSNIKNSSDHIAFLMQETTSKTFMPNGILQISSEVIKMEQLPEKRADIQAMNYVRDAYQDVYKATKSSFLPRLNAFGSYELYDDELFKADAGGYMIGLHFSWDIFQGARRLGNLQKSKAEFEKASVALQEYKAKSNLELLKAKRMVEDVMHHVRLTILGMEQSEETLRIIKNRFEQGLEKTKDLLAAESKYAQKQLEYYTVIFQYNYAQAYVQFLTKQ